MNKLVIDDAIPYLRGRIEDKFDCVYVPGSGITPEVVADADGLLVRTRTKCGEPLLGQSKVSFVATGTIGLDHFDIPWLESRGITWQNAPGCNAPAVAQYVWSALLRLGFRPDRKGHNRLGIVGKGNVGSIVAEWGRRLGAEIFVCDPPRQEAGLTDENYLPIEELAGRVDAITFHTPLTYSGKHPTYHLGSVGPFLRLKDCSIIINAARGGVIYEKALRNMNKYKHFRIAIDTWEEEPSISPETLDIVDIATPHIAGYSRQGKQRATLAILNGLQRHFGVELPLDGLARPYSPPADFSEQLILESFDPMPLDAQLRANPADFETLRDTYNFREELL